MIRRKITLYNKRKPKTENVNEELQWFCESLGLFGSRDKDKSRFRTFIILLKSLNNNEGLTSDEISERVGLSRGTVVHHLHSLRGSGLVISHRNRYMLRVDNLSSLIEEMESDILKTLDNLKKVAPDIAKWLEL
jgi:predicted transcriptional regulator